MINVFDLLKSVSLFLAAKEKNTFSHAVDARITAQKQRAEGTKNGYDV
jgi:hypothetical protein